MGIIIVDGAKVIIHPPDLDKDGVVGGEEHIYQDSDISPITTSTDMKDALGELNKDEFDKTTNTSAIELRARIDNEVQEAALTQFISLVAFRVFPRDSLKLAMTALRLSVSRTGQGRKEIVDVSTGQREHEERKAGFMGKIKNAFGGKGNEQQVNV